MIFKNGEKKKNMKLDKLISLNKALITELSPQNVKCVIHFKSEDKWIEFEGGAVTAPLAQSLEKSKAELVAYHAASSLTARYYIKEYDATVSLTFTKSPRLETRKKYKLIIEKIQEGASNAYRVSHHSLTHLLAKDAFRDTLKSRLGNIGNQPAHDFEAQESELPETLAVMALDIDYFKQVNDTWGHLYGDQVLKTFGSRLEKCALQIQESSTLTSIEIGHPSGEEFLILITARAAKEQFLIWANQFRCSVCDEVLPTDIEWRWLCKSDNLTALTPPPIPDRGVTTSIGVAFHISTSHLDPSEDPSAALLDLADTALYRAKAAGRNQVIFYDEILSSCGRVIEQDLRTGVVAIDIGSNVGVNIGQEFKVYHPTFTGKKKFSINDGRTTRTLGTYPRVESSRIVVFNTQPELSFAFIDASETAKIELDAGSHLEAIPAGSIGHLLPNTSRYLSSDHDSIGSFDIHTLQEFIKNHADDSEPPFAVVFRFTREAEFLKKYGTAALNKALARLYRGAQVTFSHENIIAVLDSGSVCIAGKNNSYSESKILAFTKEIAAEYPALEVSAGIFCASDFDEIKETDNIELDSVGTIELARFSASEIVRQKETPICHFSLKIAVKILQGLRKTRSFDTAYTDFKRLIKLGVDTAPIYNLGGLTAGSLGLDQKALEYYQAANNKDPSKAIYKTNYSIIALKMGEVDLGLKMLNTLSKDEVSNLESTHPYGHFAFAILLAKAKLSGSPLFDEELFVSLAGPALASPLSDQLQYAVRDIESALSAL